MNAFFIFLLGNICHSIQGKKQVSNYAMYVHTIVKVMCKYDNKNNYNLFVNFTFMLLHKGCSKHGVYCEVNY